jgi:hypothetical protein
MNLKLFNPHALVLAMLISACSLAGNPAGNPKVMPMPDSWDRILGFLDFAHADMTPAEIRQNAPNYSYVFSGLIWQIGDFRAGNPDINVGRYIPGFLDDHNGRPEEFPEIPWEDTPERRARTLLWWNTEAEGVGHPDWVLYKCDRVTPAYWGWEASTLPNVPVDISNPEVADWQLRNAGASIEHIEPGFSALSADLVYVENYDHACGIYRDGQWVQLFSGQESDPAFSSAVMRWAAQIQTGLHSLPSPRGFVANFPPYAWYSDEEIASIAQSLDGLLDEQGFTGYGTGRIYISEDRWLHKIRNMIAVQNQGSAYYSMNYVLTFPPSQDEIEWVLGSYLMGKEHSAYLLMTLRRSDAPDGVRWPHLPEYDADIGHPCSPMTSTQNVYVRDYSNGMTVVNPSSTTSHTFTLPEGSFRDLYGNPIENASLDLAPLTGKVLLSSGARCP